MQPATSGDGSSWGAIGGTAAEVNAQLYAHYSVLVNDVLDCSKMYEDVQLDLRDCRALVRRSQGRVGAATTTRQQLLQLPQETRRRRWRSTVAGIGAGFVGGVVTTVLVVAFARRR